MGDQLWTDFASVTDFLMQRRNKTHMPDKSEVVVDKTTNVAHPGEVCELKGGRCGKLFGLGFAPRIPLKSMPTRLSLQCKQAKCKQIFCMQTPSTKHCWLPCEWCASSHLQVPVFGMKHLSLGVQLLWKEKGCYVALKFTWGLPISPKY